MINSSIAKALLGAAVVAGTVAAVSRPASAITFTKSPDGITTSTYSGVTTVGFENVSVLPNSSKRISSLPDGSGTNGSYTENGITFTGGGIAKGSVDGQFAAPPRLDSKDNPTNNYLTSGGTNEPSPVTIALGGLRGYFGLYIGSLDTYNSLQFLRAGVQTAFFTGAQLPPTTPDGNQGVGAYYNFFGDSNSDLFDTVVLRSQVVTFQDGKPVFGAQQAAFEVDNIAVRNDIPTPALLPGLIGMGVAALRKKRKEAAEQADA